MIKYSVLKVDRIAEYGDGYSARAYIFDKRLPARIIGLMDCNGHYESSFYFKKSYKTIITKFAYKSYHEICKFKYLIIEHEVNYEVTPETYWNELGSLEKPTITQIKCYQYIINNLI